MEAFVLGAVHFAFFKLKKECISAFLTVQFAAKIITKNFVR